MPKLMFRNLKASEIDIRVQSVTEKGFILLLYKDARADMTILDEVVGPMDWKREHTRDNSNCIVSIWDKEKMQWISKEDTGSESNSDKEKGLASDSFKRACFNWGIGRELYSSPFLWVNDSSKKYITEYSGKKQVKEKFKVSEIEYTDKNIEKIKITDSKGIEVFSYGYGYKKNVEQEKKEVKKELSEDDKKEKAISMIKKMCEKSGLTYDVERLKKMSAEELSKEYDMLKESV